MMLTTFATCVGFFVLGLLVAATLDWLFHVLKSGFTNLRLAIPCLLALRRETLSGHWGFLACAEFLYQHTFPGYDCYRINSCLKKETQLDQTVDIDYCIDYEYKEATMISTKEDGTRKYIFKKTL